MTRSVLLLVFAVFGVGLVRTAWLAEDVFITLRTVDNFMEGYGLRWNAAERVQTYSHPLWMMLLALGRWVTGEYYFSTLAVGVICSSLALVLVAWRLGRSQLAAACAIGLLAFSKTFVDYSTSGLEGPLTHLLIATFAWVWFSEGRGSRRLFWIAAIAALGGVNRLDTLAIFAPAMLVGCWSTWREEGWIWMRSMALGLLPLVLWTLFSLFYYGSPIPITGFAKAFSGIPQDELIRQGLRYYRDIATRDPVLLPGLAIGLLLGLMRRDRRDAALALGAAIYCLYIVKIGGGYMAGRFLTPPLFVAAILVARDSGRFGWRPQAGFLVTVGTLGMLCSTAPILSGRDFTLDREAELVAGIVDERSTWYQRTGLLSRNRTIPDPNGLGEMLKVEFDPTNPSIFLDGRVGLDGLLAGPGVHFVDPVLCDPLLMRLPAWDLKKWQVGHFQRQVPDGYLESLAHDDNRIVHPGLASAYADLKLVTRGDLWSLERLRAIWSLSFGAGATGLRDYRENAYRSPKAAVLNWSQPVEWPETGTSVFKPEFQVLNSKGGQIKLPAPWGHGRVELMLGGRCQYKIQFKSRAKVVGVANVVAGKRSKLFPGIASVVVEVPGPAVEAGYDSIHVTPISFWRTGVYCIAGLRALE